VIIRDNQLAHYSPYLTTAEARSMSRPYLRGIRAQREAWAFSFPREQFDNSWQRVTWALDDAPATPNSPPSPA
jgi:hypothetical protein